MQSDLRASKVCNTMVKKSIYITEKVLRKLMDKIKSQREEHNSKSVNDIPEHDVTNQPGKDDHSKYSVQYNCV